MIWEPPPYQLTALSWLISNRYSGLFQDPGLGKTATALAAIKILTNAGKIRGSLVIAPLRVIHVVWPDEMDKWENFHDLTYTILHGKDKEFNLWNMQQDIYLINPEGLPWLYNELLNGLTLGDKCPFNELWIDESTKFKSHNTKTRFELLIDMLCLFRGRHIMTGTPAPKGLMDLWAQMYILDEGKALMKSANSFRDRYFVATDRNKYRWELKNGSFDKIYKRIAPLVLEMSAEDYISMPDLVYNTIKVELPKEARALYNRMEQEFFIEIDGLEATAEEAAVVSQKCWQIANGKVYEDIPDDLEGEELAEFKRTREVLEIHQEKIYALEDLIDELGGKPLMVAYYFKHDLQALQEAFGKDVPRIGAGVGPTRTRELVHAWNRQKLPLLFVHPASMAHGLNMQEGGRDLCFYSLTWSLELYQQLIARLYRQGSVHSQIRVHHLVTLQTTDEIMMNRLGTNAKQQKEVRKAIKEYRLKFNL